MVDSVVDKNGRKIELRRVGVLEQLRLFKALGPDLSENRAYFGLARLAATVAMIDGVPIPFPSSEGTVEGILDRLGEEGVDAVGNGLMVISQSDVVAEAGN
jgi:hypothetical protein